MTALRFSVCWLAFCIVAVQARPAGAAAGELEAETTEEQAIATDTDGALDDASNSVDVERAMYTRKSEAKTEHTQKAHLTQLVTFG